MRTNSDDEDESENGNIPQFVDSLGWYSADPHILK